MLISFDETANENTKIFSLEDLEKATNKFYPTHIVVVLSRQMS